VQDFLNWLATSPLATFLKVFGAVILSTAVADWAKDGNISLADWQTWVIAGLVASIPVLINWLNPQHTSYGRAKKTHTTPTAPVKKAVAPRKKVK
jgi:uncharacterized lipoprotein YddW (UPF0748 family)